MVTIATPEVGDRSYLVHDGSDALVVDPQRDIDRVLAAAEAEGVRVTHVAETHIHNDYLSGGLQLAHEAGAEYLVASAEEVAFEHTPVSPGDEVKFGALSVEVVATPGHTANHVAYVVHDGPSPVVVCTGGSLLFGSVGRTDLSGPALTRSLASRQFRSVRALAAALHDEVLVLPTHGFGSFCSSIPAGDEQESTIGAQRRQNPALLTADESAFVSRMLAGLTAFPAYYAEMAPQNREGVGPMPDAPAIVPPAEVDEWLAAGAWLVDLRDRRPFAADHLAGSVNFALAQPFTTYIGWVIPQSDGLVAVASNSEQLAEAGRCLARIGRQLGGGIVGEIGALSAASGRNRASYPVATFAELAAALAGQPAPVVLDVRRRDEWLGGHIAGAHHCFVADLPGRLLEVPPGAVWVHCASGYRAAIAASLLARAGRSVVVVDDDWSSALAASLPIVAGD